MEAFRNGNKRVGAAEQIKKPAPVGQAPGKARHLVANDDADTPQPDLGDQSPTTNQVWRVLHTAAYRLMLALRDAVTRPMPLARSEFATLRRSLFKNGARVVENAARIRIHFASACPDAALFRMLTGRLAVSGP